MVCQTEEAAASLQLATGLHDEQFVILRCSRSSKLFGLLTSEGPKHVLVGRGWGMGCGVTKCQAEIQVQGEIYELLANFIPAQGPGPYLTHPQD